ncbi:hypothetical protein GJAV_G00221330 [Gymnothorax javanicus]|nr:hypothetical protein GJAV_G00221330 [Gymnothorax javanicus]
MSGTLVYKWTDEDSIKLIQLRSANDHLFTRKRHTAKKVWDEILQQMGLLGTVSAAQAAKKWDNMKQRYKELQRNAVGTGLDAGESAAATLRWFAAMHEAMGVGEFINSPVQLDVTLADEGSDVSGSPPRGSGAPNCSLGGLEDEEEEETQAFSHYTWSYEETVKLIQARCTNEHLFTRKRHTAKKAWEEVLQQIGLLGKVSHPQAAKKWDNLKQKYKELRRCATSAGANGGEVSAATWPWYAIMHNALNAEESIDFPALMHSYAAQTPENEALDGSSSSLQGFIIPAPNQEEDGAPFHAWTKKKTMSLIQARYENEHLFTRKRHAAKKAWEEILRKIGLLGKVSPAQAAKKWDNLKQKFKDLQRPPSGPGADTAATWPFFNAMQVAISGSESIDSAFQVDSFVAESPSHVADETSDTSGLSPHASAMPITSQRSLKQEEEEEDEDSHHFSPYSWTYVETLSLILLRSENDHLFAGKRQTSQRAWDEILKQMGLKGQVTSEQVEKKWHNLKRKYQELQRSASRALGEKGEAAVAAWPWFAAMRDAVGNEESSDSPVVMSSSVAESPTQAAPEASNANGASPRESVAPSSSQARVEKKEEEEAEEEEEVEKEAEEEEDEQPRYTHAWTELETSQLIRLRAQNDHLFTGKKHTAKKAWNKILQQMGLQGTVRPAQVAKKWDNMKRKYKELQRSATGPDCGATWQWFPAMHRAVVGGQSFYPSLLMDLENLEHLSDEAWDASGSSPGSAAASCVSGVTVVTQKPPVLTHHHHMRNQLLQSLLDQMLLLHLHIEILYRRKAQ